MKNSISRCRVVMDDVESIDGVFSALVADSQTCQRSTGIFRQGAGAVCVEFSVAGRTGAVVIECSAGIFDVFLESSDSELSRYFRGALLLDVAFRPDAAGRHYLFPATQLQELVDRVPKVISDIRSKLDWYLGSEAKREVDAFRRFPMFWWDQIPNFGDSIGPWLVSSLLRVNPVNCRGLPRPGVALYSVGSTVGMIDRNRVVIWGSGLLRSLQDSDVSRLQRFTDIEVLAVRGMSTANELSVKLGWDVPPIYGDPALLLPECFPFCRSPLETVSVVLHWEHAKYVYSLPGRCSDRLVFIDVREDYSTVVKQIAESSVCISSSLHGIIVAQAYGVPWVWLRFSDHQLHSSDFKFDDFFTTIARRDVSERTVESSELLEVDWLDIAASATIPEITVDLDELSSALISRFS